MENGTFNYNLDEVRRRKVNGKYEFIAQASGFVAKNLAKNSFLY